MSETRMTRAEARAAALALITEERALAARIHAATGLGAAPDLDAAPTEAQIERASFAASAARGDSAASRRWRRITEIDLFVRNDGLWAYFQEPQLEPPSQIRADFQAIGAHAHAALFEDAIAYFASDDGDRDLEALEERYLALIETEPLDPLLVTHARLHAHELFLD